MGHLTSCRPDFYHREHNLFFHLLTFRQIEGSPVKDFCKIEVGIFRFLRFKTEFLFSPTLDKL